VTTVSPFRRARRALHRTLERQLRRHGTAAAELPSALAPLLDAVSATYEQHDAERRLLEHSMRVVSQEFVERYQRLREGEAQRELFVRHTPAAVAMFDLEGRYLLASERWREQFAGGAAVLVGRPCAEVGGALPSRWREAWERCRAGDCARAEEDTVERADGSVEWVRWELRPWWTAEGCVGGVLAFAELITERKRANALILRQAVALEASIDGIALVDASGHIVYANDAHAWLHGYASGHELVGTHWSALYEPAEVEALRGRVPEGLEAVGAWRGEATGRRRDGSAFPQELSVTLLPDRGYVSIVRDIGARRAAERERAAIEAQLRQAQKMEAVGRLAGGVAHDFNNLLTVISGTADLLRDTLAADDERRVDVDEIRRAAERAASLTRQLLAFSRQQVLQPRPVSLNAVVRDAERMLRRLIRADIALEATLDAQVGDVHVDPVQLEQVLVNLVVNARDAVGDSGRITLRTRGVTLAHAERMGDTRLGAGRWAVLEVEDTGVGMTAETRAHIFEPFYTTKAVGQGTGLGLAMVQGIVAQSGGAIVVESEPGRGTRIAVFLPRWEMAAAAGPMVHDERAPRVATPRTILLVEDDDAVRRTVRQLLERGGYTVCEAEHGVAALAVLDAHAGAIDLVLSDVVMPTMGGAELLGHVRDRAGAPPVMLMSGYADGGPALEALLAEGVEVLMKPLTPATLLGAVGRLLAHSVPTARHRERAAVARDVRRDAARASGDREP
jgi:PAS domain S-box-containing protein